MLTSAEQKRGQKHDGQRSAVVTPAAAKCPDTSVDSHPLFVLALLSKVTLDLNERK